MGLRSLSTGAKEIIQKWLYFSGDCDRETWWRALALSVVGIYLSILIYGRGLSFWLKRPDPYFTAISALLLFLSIWLIIAAAVRRSNTLSLPKKFHWLLIVTPIWIILLGTLTSSSHGGRKGKLHKLMTSSSGIKFILLISILSITALNFSTIIQTDTTTKNRNAAKVPSTRECVELGIDYYKEIGSYPLLSSGKDARTEVNERCRRSSLAFGRP